MKCEICGHTNPQVIVLLPIGQKNGNLDTIACEDCANKSSAYCKSHSRPHAGFTDGTTACLLCIEETVGLLADRSEGFVFDLTSQLPKLQVALLIKYSEKISLDIKENVLRFLVTKALRLEITVDELVEKILAEKNIALLFN